MNSKIKDIVQKLEVEVKSQAEALKNFELADIESNQPVLAAWISPPRPYPVPA